MSGAADRAPTRGAGSLIAIVMLACLPILATPGYFSHDEWQRADVVHANGLWAYIREYGVLRAGPDFGFPVRPLGFVQQGISALWMARSPLLVHLIDVGLHALTVVLLWRLLLQLRMPRRQAWLSAAAFACVPLVMLAVGWVGASFDRWYVLFSLLAAMGVARAAAGNALMPAIAIAMLCSAGAILSKETAVVLPGALLLLLLAVQRFGGGVRDWRAALLAVAATCVPIAGYLVVRWPAILGTLHGSAVATYSPSVSYLPYNAAAYLLQPFLPRAVELVSLVFAPAWHWFFAAALELVLVLALARRHGPAAVGLYLGGYFVFLLPVLPLPTPGAHYLYGSAIAFAVALVAALQPAPAAEQTAAQAQATTAGWRWAALLFCAFLGLRSLYVQNSIYLAGRCQSELLASFEPQAAIAHARGASRLRILAMPGAMEYVAVRAVFGREAYREGGPMWTVVGGTEPPRAGEALFLMGTDCRAVAQ